MGKERQCWVPFHSPHTGTTQQRFDLMGGVRLRYASFAGKRKLSYSEF